MDKMYVIMCTWKRPERLPLTLRMLEAQDNKAFEFHIFNNNPAISTKIKTLIANHAWAHQVDSPTNIGGIGRFHLAKKVNKERILFIDDDQEFGGSLIGDAHAHFEPKTVKSWWAWKIRRAYIDRIRVTQGEVDYCGTGGMVADGSVFQLPNCLNPPQRYLFIEDLWLSMFAKHHGYRLGTFNTDISIRVDGKDQYPQLMQQKNRFYQEYKNGKIRF